METNRNNTPQQQNNENKEPQESWFERNLWWIAVGAAIFILRMCNDLAR